MGDGVSLGGGSLGKASFDGRLRLSGLASGLDTQALMEAQLNPQMMAISKIEENIVLNQKSGDALFLLKEVMSALEESLAPLYGAGLNGILAFDFKNKNVFYNKISSLSISGGSGDASTFAQVSAEGRADIGEFVFQVQSLAKAHSIRTKEFQVEAKDPLNLGGDIIFVNSNNDVIGQVTIDATDSLNAIKEKINRADVGVSAFIVSSSFGANTLVLKSKNTGVDAAIKLGAGSTKSLLEGEGLDLVVPDVSTLGGSYAIKREITAASNAAMVFEGIPISRASNTITDLLPYVTFKLLKADSGVDISLKIAGDSDAIKEKIIDFANKVNDLYDFADQQTLLVKDPKSKEGGVMPAEGAFLSKNAFAKSLKSKITAIIGGKAKGQVGRFQSFSDIGVSLVWSKNSDEGVRKVRLSVDAAKLTKALNEDLESVKRVVGFTFFSSTEAVRLFSFPPDIGVLSSSPGRLSVTADSGAIVGAEWSGGNTQVSGRSILITSGESKGLSMIVSGESSLPNVEISYGVGIVAQLYGVLKDWLSESGGVEAERRSIEGLNRIKSKKLEEQKNRLESQKEKLYKEYQRLEKSQQKYKDLIKDVGPMLNSWKKDKG